MTKKELRGRVYTFARRAADDEDARQKITDHIMGLLIEKLKTVKVFPITCELEIEVQNKPLPLVSIFALLGASPSFGPGQILKQSFTFTEPLDVVPAIDFQLTAEIKFPDFAEPLESAIKRWQEEIHKRIFGYTAKTVDSATEAIDHLVATIVQNVVNTPQVNRKVIAKKWLTDRFVELNKVYKRMSIEYFYSSRLVKVVIDDELDMSSSVSANINNWLGALDAGLRDHLQPQKEIRTAADLRDLLNKILHNNGMGHLASVLIPSTLAPTVKPIFIPRFGAATDRILSWSRLDRQAEEMLQQQRHGAEAFRQDVARYMRGPGILGMQREILMEISSKKRIDDKVLKAAGFVPFKLSIWHHKDPTIDIAITHYPRPDTTIFSREYYPLSLWRIGTETSCLETDKVIHTCADLEKHFKERTGKPITWEASFK